MEASPNLRLLHPDAVVTKDDPATYAEALLELHNLRERNGRLEDENGHLTQILKRLQLEVQRLKAARHKDLRLNRNAAAVERLYEKWRLALHPRAQREIPEDRLKLGLGRLRDFDEAHLSRAIDGAIVDAFVDEKGVRHDDWELIMRSTGHVWRFIERADRAQDRRSREWLEAQPGADGFAAALREDDDGP